MTTTTQPTPSGGTPPAAELNAATFQHAEHRGIREVSLVVERGAVVGLLGPNGSGKTTILSLLAGFRAPQAGRVHVLGGAITAERRRRVGLLFQESSLDPLMTVRDTLRLHGRLFGLDGGTLRARIDELLAIVGLADRRDDDVETLSGGMKRRLELARAVLHRPDLILLDEPTLGLDPESKANLWEMLRTINAEGAALLVATNDVVEAERYCDDIAFIDHGQIVARGTPDALKGDLRHDSVRIEWPDAPGDIATTVGGWDGVGRVTTVPPVLHATVDDASAFVPRLFGIAGDGIRAIRIEASTLEDAYFQIVGETLSRNGVSGAPGAALERPDA